MVFEFRLNSPTSTIYLHSRQGSNYAPTTGFKLLKGTSGFGLSGLQQTFGEDPLGGGWLKGSRPLMRDLTLVLEVWADYPDILEERIAQAARLLREPFEIIATDMSVTAHKEWKLGCVVTDGGEDAYDDGGELSLTWTLGCTAPRPYWRSAVEIAASATSGKVIMLPAYSWDEPAPVRLRFVGPLPDSTYSHDGRYFRLAAIPSGQERILSYSESVGWEYKDAAGTSKFSEVLRVGTQPSVFPMRRTSGSSTIVRTGDTATGTIQAFVTPRRALVR